MSMSEVIQDVTKWLAWGGSGLGILTVLAYLFKWGIKFRLTGATIFTLFISPVFSILDFILLNLSIMMLICLS